MTVALRYEVSGPPHAPVVVLGASLGTTRQMWRPQIDRLSARWRVVAFDTRGHGDSPAGSGPTRMRDLADDVAALLDALGVRSYGYCGMSLGGAIGQVLAATHPDRVSALVLCCTSARFGATGDAWRERAARVRAEGTGWLVDATRKRWFTDRFVQAEPGIADEVLAMLRDTPADGYAACCDALAEFDGRPLLADIAAPTLVIAGAEDQVSPVDMALELATGIGGAELVVLSNAAHLASVEQPRRVTTLVETHLDRHLGGRHE